MVKQLQLFNRSAFYRKFVEHNFFVPLSSCLMQPSPCMRLAGIDVLLSTAQCRRMRAVAPPQRPSPWPRLSLRCALAALAAARAWPALPPGAKTHGPSAAASFSLSGTSRLYCGSTC